MNPQYFNQDGWLKDEYILQLRDAWFRQGEMTDTFGIPEYKVIDFFQEYEHCMDELEEEIWSECWEQACSDAISEGITKDIDEWRENRRDDLINEHVHNDRTLLEFYHTREINPFQRKQYNVDIHWDFARSIMVEAQDEDDAEAIVQAMMLKGEIPQSTFEATEDWELDTSYQPDE